MEERVQQKLKPTTYIKYAVAGSWMRGCKTPNESFLLFQFKSWRCRLDAAVLQVLQQLTRPPSTCSPRQQPFIKTFGSYLSNFLLPWGWKKFLMMIILIFCPNWGQRIPPFDVENLQSAVCVHRELTWQLQCIYLRSCGILLDRYYLLLGIITPPTCCIISLEYTFREGSEQYLFTFMDIKFTPPWKSPVGLYCLHCFILQCTTMETGWMTYCQLHSIANCWVSIYF